MAYNEIDPGDLLLVNRGTASYKVTAEELRTNPGGIIADTDTFLVNRGTESYSVDYINIETPYIAPDDLFLLTRGTASYQVTWAVLEDELGLGEPGGIIVGNIPATLTADSGTEYTFTFNVTTSGSPTESYQWYWNGSPVSGATGKSWKIDPWYVNDTGKTVHCVLTLTKPDYADVLITSKTCNLTIRKSANGGSFMEVTTGQGWLGEGGYPSNGNYTWRLFSGEKEGNSFGTDGDETWPNYYVQLIDLGRFKKTGCSYNLFVREDSSHQRNNVRKDFGIRGRCGGWAPGDNPNDCWGEDGKGIGRRRVLSRYAIDYPFGSGESPRKYAMWSTKHPDSGHGCRDELIELDVGRNTDQTGDTQRGQAVGSATCQLSEVPEGNETETPNAYRAIQQGTKASMRESWKVNADNCNDQWTGTNISDGFKSKFQDIDRVRARIAPYQYAYMTRSGNPPANTGFGARFEADRWYSSERTAEENETYAAERNAVSFVVKATENGIEFNGQPISEITFIEGRHYTFFMPNAPNSAALALSDHPVLDTKVSGDNNHMFQMTPELNGNPTRTMTFGQSNYSLAVTVQAAPVRDISDIPFMQDGYYPLYETEEAANAASPVGTSTYYMFDNAAYERHMPDGLPEGEYWLGDYVDPYTES